MERETRLEVEGETGFGNGVRLGLGGEMVRASIDSEVFQRAIPGGILPADVLYNSDSGFWKQAVWGQLTTPIAKAIVAREGENRVTSTIANRSAGRT